MGYQMQRICRLTQYIKPWKWATFHSMGGGGGTARKKRHFSYTSAAGRLSNVPVIMTLRGGGYKVHNSMGWKQELQSILCR